MSEEKTELHCADCKELITSGNFILVGEKNYHVEHFVCSHCKSQLAGKLYYDHEEKIYCEEDYHNICCPKCAKCSLPIKDKQFYDIIGKKYHETCFLCHQCGSAFKNGQYFNKDDNPLCAECHLAQAKKCAKCNLGITSKVYSALNKFWHFECFTCEKCGVDFKDESFVEYEGKPYHQKCYQILCVVCEKPISGEYFKIEGSKALHKECLDAYKEKQKKIEKPQIKEEKPKLEHKDEENKIPETKNEPTPIMKKEEPPKLIITEIICNLCKKPVGKYYQVEGDLAWHKDCYFTIKPEKKKNRPNLTGELQFENP